MFLCLSLSVQAQSKDEEALRIKVAQAVRMLAAEGFVNSSGHVSARIPGTTKIFINNRDASRETLQPKDVVMVDINDRKIIGQEPDETFIHTSIYRARPDVMSVIHTHALHSTSFTVAKKEILPVSVHGAIFADGVPEYKRAGKVTDAQLGDELARTLGSHRALLIRMHGAVVVGGYLEEAFCAAIQLETNAEIQMTASALGPVDRMTPEEVAQSIKESWTPRSIAKRWEYYVERERIKTGPGSSN
jgi:ribulose-5-phosphate 4-epimerase/fuculose-1-phosphate aldolase